MQQPPLTVDLLNKLLNKYFPFYRKRVVNGNDLHLQDVEVLCSEIAEYQVNKEELILALDTLQPWYSDIEYDFKHDASNPTLHTEAFYKRKMYQVGMLRLMLDITHYQYRARINHQVRKIEFLNKWNKIYNDKTSL